MSRRARHDILFEPVEVGSKVLRNRFYAVPHGTGFGVTKPYSQAAFRGMKAEGGWAAVCTEMCTITEDSDEHPWVVATLLDERDAGKLAAMTESVHSHGALAGLELTHSGVHAWRSEARIVSLGASQLATEMRPHMVPKAMELADIARLQAEWARAAKQAREIGFDIIYIYGGHSMLPVQFLSPYYNHREDKYGGSFLNRARFWLETIEAVVSSVGSECAIAVRIGVDALGPAGVQLAEALEFIRIADRFVDLWDVNVGSLAEDGRDMSSSRFFKEGYQLEWTGHVREATRKPIVGVSRFTNPDLMADTIRSGQLTLIGGARPSFADPFLPRKIEEGRYDEIRECIGCNVCVLKSTHGSHIGCTQNATAGEEYRRGWHPERFERARNIDKDVLVVGAGPAGLECAVVLGKRGFRRVHIVDAEKELGGCMRWVSRLPMLGEWNRVVEWRQIQLHKLKNVEVVLGSRLDCLGVLNYGAELVVVATGSFWSPNGLDALTHCAIDGADASYPHVLTPEQIMLDGKRPTGRRVVVYDTEGYFVATGIAETLALEGYDVDLVTGLREVASVCDETREGWLVRRHLHTLGVRMHRETRLTEVRSGRVRCRDTYEEEWVFEADSTVIVTQRMSDDRLYHEVIADADALRNAEIEGIFRVGDCVAPGLIADAIFDGHRLAREIDGPSPGIPRPYLREEMVLCSRESPWH